MTRTLLVTFLCLTALALAFATSAVLTTACSTHQCDTNFTNIDQSLGRTLGDVHPISAGVEVWESSPAEGTWISYPGEQTYFFSLPPNFQPIGPPSAWVATNPTPYDADSGGGTSTEASGQLAVYGGYGNGGFTITNATCAPYYLYVEVWGTVPTPDAGSADGGIEGSTDGSTD